MPLKKHYGFAPPPPPEPESEPGMLGRVGGLRGLLAGGTRAISGAMSAPGGPLGATISGLGELGAEAIEGSLAEQDPGRTAARLAMAAGLGAVPFGAVLKAGRPLASAARGALYSGLGTAGTEVAAGRDVDLGATLTSAAMGGGITGGLAKLFGKPIPTPVPETVTLERFGQPPRQMPVGPRTPPPVAPTTPPAAPSPRSVPIPYQYEYAGGPAGRAATKEGLLIARQQQAEQQMLKQAETYARRQALARAKTTKEAGAQARAERIMAGLVKKPVKAAESIVVPTETGTTRITIPYGKPPKGKGSARATRVSPEPPVEPTITQLMQESPREALQVAAATVPPPPTGLAAQTMEDIRAGRMRGPVSTPFSLDTPPESATPLAQMFIPKTRATTPTPAQAELLAQMFTRKGGLPFQSRVGTAGANLRLAEEATARGEIPSAEEAYQALVRERNALGEATGPRVADDVLRGVAPTPPPSPADELIGGKVPYQPSTESIGLAREITPDDVLAQLDEIERFRANPEMLAQFQRQRPPVPPGPVAPGTDPMQLAADELARIKARPEIIQSVGAPPIPPVPGAAPIVTQTPQAIPGAPRLRKKPGITTEKGEIPLALMAKLGMGAGGAAIGAAVDPMDDPVLSALIGGAAGVGLAAAPQILSRFGANPATFEGLETKLQTQGIKETARQIAETLPQVQRFNLLASGFGIIPNAFIGPYGSAVMGSLEHGLAGDPRGWAALRSLNPWAFTKEFQNNRGEALRRLAEGELGRIEGLGTSKASDVLAQPGVMMTTGDITARNFLERAGFTEEEARRMTLTSEPELSLPRGLTNIGRGKRDITSALGDILFPFRRTPANIWEQGMERLPGFGFWLQSQRDIPDPIKQQVWQQLLSVGVGGVSAGVGASLDPEAARIVRRYLTNFAGVYSMPSTIGFAAGQAIRGGKPVIPAAGMAAIQDLPLPSTRPATELFRFLGAPSVETMPSGAVPAVITELRRSMIPPVSKKPRRLSRLRGRE